MRKVIYGFNVSLDGYIEDAKGNLDWASPDEELHAFHNRLIEQAGTLLYGRRLYETMAVFGPMGDADPNTPQVQLDFARAWQTTPKVVFSRTLRHAEWAEAIVSDDIAGEVAKLKEQPGGPIMVGGADLAATFIELGLVDEYHLFVHPVLTGGGKPYFPALRDAVELRLAQTHRFASGVLMLRYVTA
jgi:dihydrofolate reductase